MTPDLSHVAWRKSSHSGSNGGECVELAQLGAIRDSKNPNGPILRLGLDAFLTEVKHDRFNRP
jgi:hypothetical protein